MKALITTLVTGLTMGCTHSESESIRRKPATTGSPIFCCIRELVYSDGWKTNGEVIVYQSNDYSYRIHWTWATGPGTRSFQGRLPTSVFDSLSRDRLSFKLEGGVPLYELGVNDTKTIHPPGVRLLEHFLWDSHIARE